MSKILKSPINPKFQSLPVPEILGILKILESRGFRPSIGSGRF